MSSIVVRPGACLVAVSGHGAGAGVLCCAISAGSASAQSKYASIVIDAGNGEVLYRANADDPKYPASLTKMMTLYLTFEALQKKRIKAGAVLSDFPQGGIPAADQTRPQGRPEDQDRARDPGAGHQVGQ